MHLTQRIAFGILTVVLLSSSCSSAPTQRKSLSSAEKAKLHISMAMAALADRDFVSAMTSLKTAEDLEPTLPEVFHARAIVNHSKGEQAAAIADVRKSLSLNPQYSDAANTLGKLLIDSGKMDEAIPYLERAAKDPLYRDADKSLSNLGVVYYKRGKFDHATRYLDKAIMLKPEGACVAYYYRGHIRIRQSHFQRAIEDYDRATRQFCASFVDAHFALGLAYEYAKEYNSARKKYLEVQSRFPATLQAEKAMERLRAIP